MADQEGAKGHTANTTEIRVLSVKKSLKIEPFKITKHPLEVGRHGENGLKTLITEIRDTRNQGTRAQ